MRLDLSTDELRFMIEAVERRGKSVSGLMPTIAETLVAAVNDVFENEGAVGGNPKWPELSEPYAERRRNKADKILQDTGNLVKSIHGEHGPDWAEASTNVPYIVFHLEGGDIMPKRNPFEVDIEQVSDDVVDMLLAHITA